MKDTNEVHFYKEGLSLHVEKAYQDQWKLPQSQHGNIPKLNGLTSEVEKESFGWARKKSGVEEKD